jgi:hypothetical protein
MSINWKAEDKARKSWSNAKIAFLEIEKMHAWGEREKEIDALLTELKKKESKEEDKCRS